MSRHIFRSNYHFFCSVVTKKKESSPTRNINLNINKKLVISQPIYKQITSPLKNIQVQNIRSNFFTKITNVSNIPNVIQPKTQPQILQNKRNAPQIKISIQKKYQPKKIEIKKLN